MKLVLFASLLTLSFSALADYKCSDLDTVLTVKDLTDTKIKSYLNSKVAHADKPVVFEGVLIPDLDSGSFFEVKTYQLIDQYGGKADLKISIIPVMSRVPCNRRVCDQEKMLSKISAELDYQGKVSQYGCQKLLP